MSGISLAPIDDLIAERHLLKHPFYRAWQEGTLTPAALRDYAAQYYRHVSAFPTYISALHSRCDDLATRQALLENLRDEEEGPENHPALWRRFADAVGCHEPGDGEVWPETAAAWPRSSPGWSRESSSSIPRGDSSWPMTPRGRC